MNNPTSRHDVTLFIVAVGAGVAAYFTLHSLLRAHQLYVSLALIAIMVLYALISWRMPLLRVRQDQAADNVYYLGLLFTLLSMAIALYEFGTAVTTRGGAEQTGARQIIANFGIALASTITGVALRLILQQIRVDPAEIETMTRMELAEASKRVKASVDNVTTELGRCHDEIRQRSTDVVTKLLDETTKTAVVLQQQIETTTKQLLASATETNTQVREQTQQMTTALEASITRLRAVEPPPVMLSRRLDKIATVLESVGEQTEKVGTRLDNVANTASDASKTLLEAANLLAQLTQQMTETHTMATQQLVASLQDVSKALDQVSDRMNKQFALVDQIEEQARRTAAEAARAQAAAIEVLTHLTAVARSIANVLKDAGRGQIA